MTREHDLPCDICRDLMPLVRDGVASEASRRAVEEHVAHCEACRRLWGEEAPPPAPDPGVLGRIRRRLYAWQGAMTAAGLILGMALAATGERAGYNILLLPVLGAAVQWLSPRRARWLPLLVWALMMGVSLAPSARFLLTRLAQGDGNTVFDALIAEGLWCLLYAVLCALGMLAAALFRYALRKEEPHDPLEEELHRAP